MTAPTPKLPTPKTFTDSEGWLENFRARQSQQAVHVCGRCKTPYGRSAIPCPNDPAHDPLDALRARLGTTKPAEGETT